MVLPQNSGFKIDFLVCGTQKGGTTALFHYLKLHPEVFLPQVKEIHFFDNDINFLTQSPNYDEYHHHFQPQEHHRIIGEVTPIYMYWMDAPRRIWVYNPKIKIILILRNPIERAYSQWKMECDRNVECLSFWDALQAEVYRLKASQPSQNREFSYLDRGFYCVQINRIWSYFDRNQVLILKNEDLRNSPCDTMNRIFKFLGVNPLVNISKYGIDSVSYSNILSQQESFFLFQYYEFEIKQLELMLNWDCKKWRI